MPRLKKSSSTPLRHLLIAASAFTLMACATATPYQPASEPGGYDGFSQQLIENDRARVTFGGNSLTDRDTVENYLLYRSAEVALERGFTSFTLQARDVEENKKVRVNSGVGFSGSGFRGAGFRGGFGYDPYFGYSFFNARRGWSRSYPYSRFGGFRRSRGFGFSGFHRSSYDPFFDDIHVREITKYRATAEVKFGRNINSNDPRTFNAQEVIDNLASVITFPEEGK